MSISFFGGIAAVGAGAFLGLQSLAWYRTALSVDRYGIEKLEQITPFS